MSDLSLLVQINTFRIQGKCQYNADLLGVHSLAPKRFNIEGVSFRVISSPMNATSRDGFIGSTEQNCGVQTKNGDFLAIFGL